MFVADLHNDLVQRMMLGEDVTIETNDGHTDIPRLKKSIINLQVLIIFVGWESSKESNYNHFELATRMYEKLITLSKEEDVNIVNNLEEIQSSYKHDQLSIPISMEGGEAIENKIENLHFFIDKGLLYFGPTWNHSLDWVSSGYDETYNQSKLKNIGLNKFGIEIIKTCEENQVLIDVSHIGEKSFWDIYQHSKKPFIASHSSVYKICPHFRNLKDDQIKAIKKKQGLIGVNPYPFFIDPTFKKRHQEILIKYKSELNNIEKSFSTKSEIWIMKQHFLQKKLVNICPDFDIFIDHIDYIKKLIGIDFIAIGSDYDGLDCLPKDWNNCLDHIKIIENLNRRGYKDDEIEKIMGKNFLRVLELVNY